MKKQLNFILLNGAMGSGKSTVGNILQRKLKNTAILEIEDVRRLLSDREDNALAWKIILQMCAEYFKNGISVLLKQTVAAENIVHQFLRLAKKHRARISFYHFQAPNTVLLKRIAKRKKSGKVSKDLIISNINKHAAIKYPGAAVIDTSRLKPAQIANIIQKGLKN